MTRHRWLAAALAAASLAQGCSDDCPDSPGVVCVTAGTGVPGFDDDGHAATQSRLYSPLDVAFAPDGTEWIIDFNNHRLRTIEPDGTLRTRVGQLFPGDGDKAMADLTEAGALGTDVRLNHPTDLLFEPGGTVLFAAWHNFKLRQYDPADGRVRVTAGGDHAMGGFAGDAGPAARAAFNFPKALTRTADGTLYVLDQRNLRIRRITADGTIDTLLGDGTAGEGMTPDGPLAGTRLRLEVGNAPQPSGALIAGPDGALYMADSLNHRVRRIDLVQSTITTVAGSGEAGWSGDGGSALTARLNNPRDLAFGAEGRLYVADTDNHAIRVVDLTAGTIDTVLGTGVVGTGSEGQAPRSFALNKPWGIAFDARGRLRIADTENHRVLRMQP